MLTARGWAALGFALVAFAVARVLGIAELHVVTAALVAVVAVSWAWTASARLRLGVTRRVRPARVHAGDDSRVQLVITNRKGRATPVLELRDPVSGTPGATTEIGPISGNQTTHLVYHLPTERRGVLRIGPATLTVTDPLGLAAVRLQAAPVSEVLVLPRVVPLTGVPSARGPDRRRQAASASAIGRVGDELYALRDYVVGDDLRRVHWPSTARRGDLMVRHDEQPTQGHVTVVVDLRPEVHVGRSLELAVTAAASVASAATAAGDRVRLVGTDGTDSGDGTGPAHLGALLERLAVVQAQRRHGLRATLARLRRSAAGGTLVVVTGRLDAGDHRELSAQRTAYGATMAVEIHPSAHDATVAPPVSGAPGDVARWDANTTLADAWRRAAQRPVPAGARR